MSAGGNDTKKDSQGTAQEVRGPEDKAGWLRRSLGVFCLLRRCPSLARIMKLMGVDPRHLGSNPGSTTQRSGFKFVLPVIS
jgi:hypothetical protein